MNELSALHSQPTRADTDEPITGQEKPFALEIVHDRFELKNKINTPYNVNSIFTRISILKNIILHHN